MSGHSKWHKIRHKKGVDDAKKSKIFSKMSRIITIAAREKGGDLNMNPRLRMVVEKAKSFNMTQDSIERAIKKGTGGEGVDKLEEVVIEVFGPGGTPMIVTAITDNKNRTIPEIKHLLSKNNAKLAGEGSVRWMFDFLGVLEFEDKGNFEEMENLAIEVEVEDIKKEEKSIFVFTQPRNFSAVKEFFEKKGINSFSAELSFIPKNPVDNSKNEEKIISLMEVLEEHDDVQEVYVG